MTGLLSSVRNDVASELAKWFDRKPGWRLLQPTYRDLSIELEVDVPEKVGLDRLLAASAAARRIDTRPLIIVQAGSAVTVDLLTRRNDRDVFEGGVILPGVPMMLRLLGRAAERLPQLEAQDFRELPELPGKNTAEAMQCGVTAATAGGLRLLADRYRQLHSGASIVVSGGDGPHLFPLLEEPKIEVPHLVLQGLLDLAL